MPRPDPDDERSFMMKYAEYSQLAIALPAGTFVGYLIGWLLDKWLGTTFLWLVFLVLGSVGRSDPGSSLRAIAWQELNWSRSPCERTALSGPLLCSGPLLPSCAGAERRDWVSLLGQHSPLSTSGFGTGR